MAIYIQYMFPRDTQTRDFDAIQSTCVLELYGNNRRLSRVYVVVCPFIAPSSMKEVCMSYSQNISSLLLKCEETQRRTLSIGSI